jgi:hypothetical protein
MMKRKPMFMAVVVLVCVTVFNINLSPPLATDIITIIGEVNETNQIVVEGDIYEVDDTPVGDDLVKNYIQQKVEVSGKLSIEGDMRIIAVKSFKVIKKWQ